MEQRQSAEVYRRRRIVVGVLALLMISLIIWLVSWAVSAVKAALEPREQTASEQHHSDSSQGDGLKDQQQGDSQDKDQQNRCDPAVVKLTASTAAESFSLTDQEAILEMTIENTSKTPCTLNVGTKVQEFVVTSGSDRIFSSRDCQVDGEDQQWELKPGKKELVRFPWKMVRSAPKCPKIDTKLRPGTYNLKVKLGRAESKPQVFFLR